VAEAVTAISAAGLVVAVPVALGVGVGVAVAVDELVGLGEAVALVVLGVLLAVAEGELLLAAAEGEVVDAAAEGELLALVVAVAVALDGPDADEVAAMGGEAAMAVPVTPLAMTKTPVARPMVTGLECADRMRTPCLSWLSRLGNVLSGMLCHSGVSRCLLVEDASIRHQNRHSIPPLRHTSPQFVSAPRPGVTSARAGRARLLPGPNSPTFSLPRTVPIYARLSKRKPACAHLRRPVVVAP
jgi:hypothetical protein